MKFSDSEYSLLRHHMAADTHAIILRMDLFGRILDGNAGAVLGFGPLEPLKGVALEELLSPSQATACFEPRKKHLLSFVFKKRQFRALCRFYHHESGILMIGEPLANFESPTIESMTRIQNQFINAYRELQHRNSELEEARSTIKIMGDLLPICSHCKRIRDDQGYWQKLETFLLEHNEIAFTHSLCKECEHSMYGDLEEQGEPSGQAEEPSSPE